MRRPYMAGVGEVRKKIEQGCVLFLAGDEKLLEQLPRGNWAGGTIPYFMSEKGGVFSREKIQVLELPPWISGVTIKTYDHESLFNVYKEAPENGFSMIVIPHSSRTQLSFALNAPLYDGFALKPLIGWISGVSLQDLGRVRPKVFDGRKARGMEDRAVVMHVSLPAGKTAEVGIINLCEQDPGSDVFTFDEDSFKIRNVRVNGQARVFFDYIKEKKLNTKLPLVANYNGAMINAAFLSLDESSKEVGFYAPVFKGIEYRLARPVKNYIKQFSSRMKQVGEENILYSCNCLLNYLYTGLEGKKTAGITGPVTYGEVAYQLMTQTLVYLKIGDVKLAEQLRGENAMRTRFQFLETLLNAIPNPVYFKNLQGKYIGCNSAYEGFMGLPKERLIGKTAFEIMSRANAELFYKQDSELFRNPGQQSFELKLQDDAGNWRDLVFYKTTFADANGRQAGLIGVISDDTERKKAEEQLAQSQKLAAVGQLAGGVAHEFNNMLQLISGNAEYALKVDDRAAVNKSLNAVLATSERATRIVSSLLTFSKPDDCCDAHKDLRQLLDLVFSLVEIQLKKQNIGIVRDYGDIPPVRVNGNEMQQVFLNLINNARDAMLPAGGKLTVSVRKKRDCVEMLFSDTGRGIEPENLGKVFEPFFTTKGAFGGGTVPGTGLGLFVCYGIVQRHGGTISVESTPGKGTTFKIELPVDRSRK